MAKIIKLDNTKRPRILTLDLDSKVEYDLKKRGFNVIPGSTGLLNGTFNIPVYPQNIDIVIYKADYPVFSLSNLNYIIPGTDSRFIGGNCKPIQEQATSIIKLNNFNTISKYLDTYNRWLIILLGKVSSMQRRFLDELTGVKATLFAPKTENYPIAFENLDKESEYLSNYIENLSEDIKDVTAFSSDTFQELSFDRDPIFYAICEAGNFYSFLLKPMHAKKTSYMLVVPCFGYPKESEVSLEILSTIGQISADLFSENYITGRWIDSDKYKLNDALRIKEEINVVKLESGNKIRELSKKLEEAEKEGEYYRRLLTNGNDASAEEEKQLKPVVIRSFELLGFKVTDMDKKREKEPLREDLLVEDLNDKFKALVEVKGTEIRGAKLEYIDDLRRHLRHYEHENNEHISGILILNYESNKDVDLRGGFYVSHPAEVEKAKEDKIGLLSTVVLFEMIKTVLNSKEEQQLKERIRGLIKNFGIIKFG